jgi:hypothetical protein
VAHSNEKQIRDEERALAVLAELPRPVLLRAILTALADTRDLSPETIRNLEQARDVLLSDHITSTTAQ